MSNSKFLYYFNKLLLLNILLINIACSKANSVNHPIVLQTDDYLVERVANDLSVPWGMVFITPTTMLITEKNGKLKKLHINTGKSIIIDGLPIINSYGQGGLMDIALHPNYKQTKWLYFTYIKNTINGYATTLARSKLVGNRLSSWQDILITKSTSNTGRHFGSRITFDESGHIFFSIGDRGVRANGQDLSTHAGTIVRLNLDGTIPKDNPFISNTNILPHIYSYGHRNPQGLFYDKMTNRLWSIEHGPRGGDEINLINKGANYGWPVISYGKEYWGPVQVGEGTNKIGMEQPIKQYTPSIAPSSLIVYSGKAFPKWQGNLLAGALKLTHLNRVVVDKNGKAINEERLLKTLRERLRVVVESIEGWLYIATDSGKILRIRPSQ